MKVQVENEELTLMEVVDLIQKMILNVAPRGHSVNESASNVNADITNDKSSLSFKFGRATYIITTEKRELGVVNEH
jgi:hypothetical protein